MFPRAMLLRQCHNVTSHCDALRLRPVIRFNEPHVVYVQVSDPAFDAHQTDLFAIEHLVLPNHLGVVPRAAVTRILPSAKRPP